MKNGKPKFKIDKSNKSSEITALKWGRNLDEILIGNTDGDLKIFNSATEEYISVISNLKGEGQVTGIDCKDNNILVARKNGIVNIWNNGDNDIISLNLNDKGSLDKMTMNSSRDNIIGTGGENNHLKLWDISTKKCIFQAKSVNICFITNYFIFHFSSLKKANFFDKFVF